MEVYLFYETDAWLSKDSMVLLGVFDSMVNGVLALKNNGDFNELAREEAYVVYDNDNKYDKESSVDNVMDDLYNNLQTQGGSEKNYYVEELTINDYIG